MSLFKDFYEALDLASLSEWRTQLEAIVPEKMSLDAHGDLKQWMDAFLKLPEIKPTEINLNASKILIGKETDASKEVIEQLEKLFRELHPWRKGPFEIFGKFIDTEWRSDLKWERLKREIQPLRGRKVLDVGCGSGYHVLRMVGEGAEIVAGIDPTLLFVMQFLFLNKYLKVTNATVLPLGVEDLPDRFEKFDTVFSMGIFYHRRSPFEHLSQLRSLLREEGELVLETLVIEGDKGEVLVPEGRYAKMPNVWFIPSPKTLQAWLKRAGFSNIRLVDVTLTTPEEQRKTDWMTFQTLNDFLDPNDSSKTIEGYPAPKRAIFTAEK